MSDGELNSHCPYLRLSPPTPSVIFTHEKLSQIFVFYNWTVPNSYSSLLKPPSLSFTLTPRTRLSHGRHTTCEYVFTCVYGCECVGTCVPMCVYVHVGVRTSVCTWVSVCRYVRTHVFVWVCMCTWVCTCVYVEVGVCTCTCVCTWVCVCS